MAQGGEITGRWKRVRGAHSYSLARYSLSSSGNGEKTPQTDSCKHIHEDILAPPSSSSQTLEQAPPSVSQPSSHMPRACPLWGSPALGSPQQTHPKPPLTVGNRRHGGTALNTPQVPSLHTPETRPLARRRECLCLPNSQLLQWCELIANNKEEEGKKEPPPSGEADRAHKAP